ncbi:hypothetical protein NDU88_003214 [Pleurodeles waltl]|uniref:Uncharacterized protein n=1 Tax=Pleurodeles waltl TaxID=8319 RepID=A0AAV7PCF5_PLEWA|nr:hypothetical protein NDU88_003214 [Pleurodeles waltl]
MCRHRFRQRSLCVLRACLTLPASWAGSRERAGPAALRAARPLAALWLAGLLGRAVFGRIEGSGGGHRGLPPGAYSAVRSDRCLAGFRELGVRRLRLGGTGEARERRPPWWACPCLDFCYAGLSLDLALDLAELRGHCPVPPPQWCRGWWALPGRAFLGGIERSGGGHRGLPPEACLAVGSDRGLAGFGALGRCGSAPAVRAGDRTWGLDLAPDLAVLKGLCRLLPLSGRRVGVACGGFCIAWEPGGGPGGAPHLLGVSC